MCVCVCVCVCVCEREREGVRERGGRRFRVRNIVKRLLEDFVSNNVFEH